VGALKEIFAENTSGGAARPREQIVDELFRLLEGGYLRINKPKPPSTPEAAKRVKRATKTRA
jgi:hypothetical protein